MTPDIEREIVEERQKRLAIRKWVNNFLWKHNDQLDWPPDRIDALVDMLQQRDKEITAIPFAAYPRDSEPQPEPQAVAGEDERLSVETSMLNKWEQSNLKGEGLSLDEELRLIRWCRHYLEMAKVRIADGDDWAGMIAAGVVAQSKLHDELTTLRADYAKLRKAANEQSKLIQRILAGHAPYTMWQLLQAAQDDCRALCEQEEKSDGN